MEMSMMSPLEELALADGLAQAHAAIVRGDLAEARATYPRLLERYGRSFQLCFDYGRFWYLEHDLDESVSFLQSAVEMNPDHIMALLWCGDLYALGFGVGKNYVDAYTLFTHVLELDPAASDAYAYLAQLHRDPGIVMSDETWMQLLHQAVALDAGKENQYNLAMGYLTLGQIPSCLQIFYRLLDTLPRTDFDWRKRVQLNIELIEQQRNETTGYIPPDHYQRYRWFEDITIP